AFTNETAHVVFRQQAFHQAEHSFIQRNVHYLAFAPVTMPRIKRHERADDAVHGSYRVPQADACAHWRSIRIAGDESDSAHRFTDRTESRLIAVGAGLTVARQ